ncbi:MAG: class I SAM-dependent DNA methyltransferase [Saprospiraceae bacterium]|nr:class I SAM-dependent DNA methyltransferase [Saprospiraceae bacterium]
MALNWNEIKDRAVRFSKEWEDTTSEDAEAKSFLDAFFEVFGIPRKKIGTFEHRIKKLDEGDGYIDMLWKGHILVEMKSRGKDLDRAFRQAKDYTHGLKQEELPKYILISDFHHFRLYDSEEMSTNEFTLPELYKNVGLFGYLIGVSKKVYKEQDPANIKAAELMGKLHDRLEEIGYEGHPLEVYLVRLLFCLFAEDTSIFEKQQFQDFLEQRTNEDGSDLAAKLQELFQVLNTDKDKRFKNLDEQLNDFPYVNGKLFEESLPTASFDSKMRKALLDCCYIDWSKISPAIFGSMFQSVMNPKERRNLGAHYTSEKNILKLIKPLFLDELWKEFESLKSKKNELPKFHQKLSTLHFLDPACGCGNFLVITYRELRILELDVLREIYKNQMVTDVESVIWINVDQFYGIEYEEFPARIAEVAMWLIDHQMNMLISYEFGQYFARLPLKKAAKILHGDAMETDWDKVVPKDILTHIIGNPPFIGSKIMTQKQRDQIVTEFGTTGSGVLDYVTGWYVKAAKYIYDTKIKVAFVSTNSIVQGEQTSILWGLMLQRYGIKIHFAHRTFKWSNEAKGNAAVYCVIIGFANFSTNNKVIYEYENIKGEPHEINAKNINPYLVDAKDIFVSKRRTPICYVPEISFGSMPNDGGNFLFSDTEKNEFVLLEPKSEQYFKPLISAHEFLNGHKRWCLWLKDANPSDLRGLNFLSERIENVKKMRAASTRDATKRLAAFPTLFGEDRQPKDKYVLIPRHSSENRKYIPMGFFDANSIASDSCLFIESGKHFHFGILMSTMHMSWVKNICGRIKSDYRYSNELVYNNFPWPENPTDKQKQSIEEKAQKVLDVRAQFPDSSLADLYDPLTMPPALVKAHNDLDKAVDLAYRSQPFTSEANRMEFLFGLYEKYTADLFTVERKGKRK